MGMIDTLGRLSSERRSRTDEAVQGVWDAHKRKKIRSELQRFQQEYPNPTKRDFMNFNTSPEVKSTILQLIKGQREAFPEKFETVSEEDGYGIQVNPLTGEKKSFGTRSRATTDPRTSLQKEYDRYIKNNPSYKGNILTFTQDKSKGTTDKDAVYQKKIKDLMRVNPGMSEQEATGVATGTIKIFQDEVAGTRYVVDMIKGTERALTPEKQIQPKEPRKEGSEQKTIWEHSELGTGPFSALKAGVSVPSGALGGPIAEKTIQARQAIRSSTNDLIRALSINPRFPVGEINRIKEEINLSPSILDNPKMFRARAVSIAAYLKRKLKNEQAASKNTKLPVATRRNAAQSAKDIRNFIGILGVPKIVKNILDYKSVKSGEKYIDPKGITRTKL